MSPHSARHALLRHTLRGADTLRCGHAVPCLLPDGRRFVTPPPPTQRRRPSTSQHLPFSMKHGSSREGAHCSAGVVTHSAILFGECRTSTRRGAKPSNNGSATQPISTSLYSMPRRIDLPSRRRPLLAATAAVERSQHRAAPVRRPSAMPPTRVYPASDAMSSPAEPQLPPCSSRLTVRPVRCLCCGVQVPVCPHRSRCLFLLDSQRQTSTNPKPSL
jgi:hypothetical protein